MFRSLLLLPALLGLCGSVAASTIRGTVSGPENKPFEFAVVTLLSANDSSLVKGGVTDAAGAFSLENISGGSYLLTVSFTGYTKATHGPFTLSGDTDYVVPAIALLSTKEMNAVTIFSTAPLFQQKPGMLVMNVEGSPVRIAGTAWDLLYKVPGVFIDQNNNISLKGKSGVKVYIDDRPSYLSGDQLKTYLQSMSAEDISNIEIIYSPGAKYDAEGTAGILNLITKKGARQGLHGNVRLGYGIGLRPKYFSSGNFNYAKEKFNIYGSAALNQRYDVERVELSRRITYAGNTSSFGQHNTTYGTSPVYLARLGIDFFPNEKVKYGFRGEFAQFPHASFGDNTTQIQSTANDSNLTLHQQNYSTDHSGNYGWSAYLKYKFDTLGQELSFSSDFLTYFSNSKEKYNLHFIDASGAEVITPQFQRSSSDNSTTIFVFKSDYTLPFKEKYKLESGIKTSYVETDNALVFDLLHNNTWSNDTTRSNTFIYKEMINAAYVNFSADLGKLQVMAGLRAEQTLSDGNSPTTGERLKKEYAQLFPSFVVTHKISDKHSVTYSYSRRINRPDYQSLNPFVYYLDQYTYQVGNPFLQPEIAHESDITYSFRDALFVSAGYNLTLHSMTDVTHQIDSTGVTFQTQQNFDKFENMYVGLSFPVPIGEHFMMENQLNYYINRFKSFVYGSPVDNQSRSFNASTNLTLTLKGNWKIQAWGWYRSAMAYGIFDFRPIGGVGGGITKMMLDNRLMLNVSMYDIFRTNTFHTHIEFQGQHVDFKTIPESPSVYFGFRYSFGKTKAAKKSEYDGGAGDLQDRTKK